MTIFKKSTPPFLQCLFMMSMICAAYGQKPEVAETAIIATPPPNSCYEPRLEVSPSSAEMVFGETRQFRASLITNFPMAGSPQVVCPESNGKSRSYEKGTDLEIAPIGQLVSWSTSDAALATVTSTGLVEITGREGSVYVVARAKVDGRLLTDSALITITPEDLKVTIEPAIVKLSGKGEQVRLQALVNGRIATNVIWSSSRPEQISVASGDAGVASGLVTAETDLGSAMITAQLATDVLHEPAMVNAMVVRQQDNVVDIPKADIISLEYDLSASIAEAEALLPQAELVLAPNYSSGDLPFSEGDVVTNAEYGGILVNEIEFTSNAIIVRGRQPSLTEVFTDLDIRYSEEDYTQFFELYAEKSGVTYLDRVMAQRETPSPLLSESTRLSRVECETLLRFEWGLEPLFETEFKVRNRKVEHIRMISGMFLAPTLIADSKIEAAMECAFPLVPPTILPLYGAFPSAGGILTLAPHVYSNLEIEVAMSFLHQVPRLDAPAFSASTGIRSVFEMNGETGEASGSLEPQPVESSLSLNLFSGESSFSVDMNLGVTVGMVWSIMPGYPAPPFKFDYTDVAAINVYAPEYKLAFGRGIEVPDEMLMFQSAPGYRGPEGHDYAQFTAKPVKSVELGGLLESLAAFFGFEDLRIKPATEFELLPTVTTPWPKFEDFSTEVDTLYVGGYPLGHERYHSYPGEVEIRMPVGNHSGWGGSGRGWSKKELWAEYNNEGFFSQLRTGIDSDVYVFRPQASEAGELTLRGHLDYFIPGFPLDVAEIKPHVSSEIHLSVKQKPQLEASPAAWNLVQIPGGSQQFIFDVINTGSQAVTFHFESSDAEFFLPPGNFNLEAGASFQIFNLFVQCNNESYYKTVVADIVNETTNERTPVTVYLHCALFDISPNPVGMSGTVNKWVSKTLNVHNITDNAESVSTSASGVSIFPESTVIDGNSTAEFTLNYHCGSVPSKSTHIISLIAGGYTQQVAVNTECKDAGSSTGDPHLISFDRHKFDFQGKGEFVLSRWVGGDSAFEIQARQMPFGSSSKVTVNQAVAFNVHGDTVSLYTRAQAPGGEVLMLNDSPLTLLENESYTLPSSGSTLTRTGNGYDIVWQNGAHARVIHHGHHLALSATPPSASEGQLVGVLGNFNNNPEDDFALRDGTVLSFPPIEESFYDCSDNKLCFAYHPGQGWLIRTPEESLFSYTAGKGPMDFAPAENEQFPVSLFNLNDYPAGQITAAQASCSAQGVVTPELLEACTMDILLTGDSTFALVQAELEVEPEGEVTPGDDPISCKAIREAGSGVSGYYDIDPDGNGPLGSINVYCDLTNAGGGWTFKQITNGLLTMRVSDNDSCKAIGLQLFAPRTAQDYSVASAYATSLGPVNLGPLGVYHTQTGNAVAAPGKPMNSSDTNNAAAVGWVSTAGADWWMSSRTDINEPSGDYAAGCWLDIGYNNFGWVNSYNDFDGDGTTPVCMENFSGYRDYLCMHADNLTLVPPSES